MNPLPVKCKHWSDCGVTNGGCCAIAAYYKPAIDICLRYCNKYDGPSRGLGDTINKVTKALGIPTCGKCEEDRQKLNEKVPYKP